MIGWKATGNYGLKIILEINLILIEGRISILRLRVNSGLITREPEQTIYTQSQDKEEKVGKWSGPNVGSVI